MDFVNFIYASTPEVLTLHTDHIFKSYFSASAKLVKGWVNDALLTLKICLRITYSTHKRKNEGKNYLKSLEPSLCLIQKSKTVLQILCNLLH